jgi:hypothetical protein
MAVEHEEHSSVVKQEGESLPVVLNHGSVCLLRVVINCGVVPIAVESSEVVLARNGAAGTWNTIQENPSEVSDNSRVDTSGLEGFKGREVITMCTHMGAPNPPHQIRDTTVEVEEGSGGHSHPIFVHSCLWLPTFGKSTNAMERSVPIVCQQVTEDGGREIGPAEGIPGDGVIVKKTWLPEREENMPEAWGRIETLRQVVLTEGLV